MSSIHIIWPVLAQVFLTLIMYIVLASRRLKVAKAGQLDKRAALDSKAWPENVIQISNNVANQFEAPVLFYVLCLVIYNTNIVNTALVVLAWLFTLSRYAHAYVHASSNHVPTRFRFFLLGLATLLVMLIIVVWRLAS